MISPNQYIKRLGNRVKEQRGVFILYSILRLFVVLIAIRSVILHNYDVTATCLLVLALFFIPSLLEETLKIRIPALFEGIIYCFIFAAEILGELGHFYTEFPLWDTMLHTLNGFLFAAVGFSTVELLNRTSKNISLSPLYLTMVAFCFSMTIGVLWEFFECGADLFLGQDMQKDFIVDHFQSVTLDPTHSQQVIPVEDITGTIIHTGSGEDFVIDGGYLDIGILDTMKDLFVNFIGAIVFCSFGFAFLKYGEKKKVANKVVQGLTLKAEMNDEKDSE
ncbi:MAG: hypothetical protein ACSW8G_03780 [Bacillota bacterium]